MCHNQTDVNNRGTATNREMLLQEYNANQVNVRFPIESCPYTKLLSTIMTTCSVLAELWQLSDCGHHPIRLCPYARSNRCLAWTISEKAKQQRVRKGSMRGQLWKKSLVAFLKRTCHVPSNKRPLPIGILRLTPIRLDFTCPGMSSSPVDKTK